VADYPVTGLELLVSPDPADEHVYPHGTLRSKARRGRRLGRGGTVAVEGAPG